MIYQSSNPINKKKLPALPAQSSYGVPVSTGTGSGTNTSAWDAANAYAATQNAAYDAHRAKDNANKKNTQQYNPATNPQTQDSPYTGTGTTTPTTGSNIYNSADANYIRNLPTAYTPEQQLLMKNSATNVAAAGQRGTSDKIRETMAAMGTGGGGGEIGALTNSMIGGNQALGQNLSNIDIANANAGLQGGFAKAGLLNSLMGTGMDQNRLAESASQFDIGQYNDLYKYNKDFDYNQSQDALSNSQYIQQMNLILKQLGLPPMSTSYSTQTNQRAPGPGSVSRGS